MISLRGGFAPADTETCLRNAAYDARTVGGSFSNVELIHEYLRWVNKQTRMLKNRISSDDLERLVLTPVYWALQTASRENPDNSVFDLVAAEISDRDTTLISAADEVKSEIERWNQPNSTGVVLDTNVLLEYGDVLLSTRWHDLVGNHSHLYMLVTRAAIDELDMKKMSRDTTDQGKKVRSQAKAAIRSLESMFTKVTTQTRFQLSEPPHNIGMFVLPSDELDHQQLGDIDAEIIDRAQTVAPFIEPIIILTYDLGMALRSRAAGVQAVRLEYTQREANTP